MCLEFPDTPVLLIGGPQLWSVQCWACACCQHRDLEASSSCCVYSDASQQCQPSFPLNVVVTGFLSYLKSFQSPAKCDT